MHKKFILIFLLSLYITVYANDTTNNINIANGVVTPTSQSSGSKPLKAWGIKYIAFDYQMPPKEFANFMEKYNLTKTADLHSTSNIIYLKLLKENELNKLNQKLRQTFSEVNSGNTQCIIDQTGCGGSTKTTTDNSVDTSSIIFKTDNNKDLSVQITSDHHVNSIPSKQVSFQAEALLLYATDKNYIIITQFVKNGICYGKFLLVSLNIL